MFRIALAGFPKETVTWLRSKLTSAEIEPLSALAEVQKAWKDHALGLLVLNSRIDKSLSSELLKNGEWGGSAAPLLVCVEAGGADKELLRKLQTARVHGLIEQPVDRRELLKRLEAIVPPQETTTSKPLVTSGLKAIWNRHKGLTAERLEHMARAAAAAQQVKLSPEGAEEARQAAHKLAGSLGTFGSMQGTLLAREYETSMGPSRFAKADPKRLRALVEEISRETAKITAQFAGDGDEVVAAQPVRKRILVVAPGADPAGQALADEAQSVGLEVIQATSASDVRQRRLLLWRPDVAIISNAIGNTEMLELIAETSGDAAVIAISSQDSLNDRLEIARRGAVAFFEVHTPPEDILQTVTEVLQMHAKRAGRLLAVDDDPKVLDIIRSLLEPEGIEVDTISDPFQFWEKLQESTPDVVLLDVDMPRITGLELCRVLRNDRRWASLPVVFLANVTDESVVKNAFAAGADDFISKPITGAELLLRIRNRLERSFSTRFLADADLLTGAVTRRRCLELLTDFMRLASRQREHITVALLDLDHFKKVNDQYGHAVGDTVLRYVGQLMLRNFRTTDVVCRWGGEEFLIGMYGANREQGARSMQKALAELRGETFHGPAGVNFHMSFSAGLAQFPEDNKELDGIIHAADELLYAAKIAGRNRVVTSRTDSAEAEDANRAALAGLEPTADSVLRRVFTQFHFMPFSMGLDINRLRKERFNAVILPLSAKTEHLLKAIRGSRVNANAVIFGIAPQGEDFRKLLRYRINAVLEEPFESKDAAKMLRATHLLAIRQFRKQIRFPLVADATVKAGKKQFAALLQDISAGGATLAVDMAPPKGGKVEALLRLPGTSPVTVKCKVQWSHTVAKRIGVQFEKKSPGCKRIGEWLMKELSKNR